MLMLSTFFAQNSKQNHMRTVYRVYDVTHARVNNVRHLKSYFDQHPWCMLLMLTAIYFDIFFFFLQFVSFIVTIVVGAFVAVSYTWVSSNAFDFVVVCVLWFWFFVCVCCYIVIIRLVNFDFMLRHNKQENVITSQWTNMKTMNIQWIMLCSEFDGNACICLLFQNDDDVGVVAVAAVFILYSGFCLFCFLATWTISNALRRV